MRQVLIGLWMVCVCGVLPCAAGAQKAPYLAVVLQDDTPLRAAAGPTYYSVGQLKAGSLVRVDDVLFNWSRVAVPKGSKSYIRQQHVDRRGDGTLGVVNSNYVEVFAIGIGEQNTSPDDAYIAHGLVPKGGRVKILESVSGYYLIESPETAYAFLEPGSVRQASSTEIALWESQSGQAKQAAEKAVADAASAAETEVVASEPETQTAEAAAELEAIAAAIESGATEPAIAESEAAAPSTSEPQSAEPEVAEAQAAEAIEAETLVVTAEEAEPAVVTAVDEPAVEVQTQATQQTPEPSVVDAGKDAPAPMRVVSASGSPSLVKTENQMLPMFLLPAEEQPLDAMQKAYADLQDDSSLTEDDRALVATRLSVIASNRKLADTIRQLRAAQKAIEVARAQEAAQPSIAPNRYDQIGMLVASTLYDGVSLPKLYRLVDPTSQRTIAYVEPKPGQAERAKMDALVGKVVGLNGKDIYDASLRRRVFSPTALEMIRPAQPEPVQSTASVDA